MAKGKLMQVQALVYIPEDGFERATREDLERVRAENIQLRLALKSIRNHAFAGGSIVSDIATKALEESETK